VTPRSPANPRAVQEADVLASLRPYPVVLGDDGRPVARIPHPERLALSGAVMNRPLPPRKDDR
jgi:hypothetical protein